MTRPASGIVVSKKPNTPAIRNRRALVTPASPIPTEAPKLESPTAKPTSTTANTGGDANECGGLFGVEGRGMSSSLLFVTQVAPYPDGPAGVHGVLDQAATGVGEIAELAGLRARRVDDVRELDVSVVAAARVVALFTIGETPWSAQQRAALLDGVRAGRVAVGGDPLGHRLLLRLGRVRPTRRRSLRRASLDPGGPARCRGPRPSRTAHLGGTWRWRDEVYQFRDLRTDADVLVRAPEPQLDLHVTGEGGRSSGFRSHGASPRARDACSRPAWVTFRAPGKARRILSILPGAWPGPSAERRRNGCCRRGNALLQIS